MKIILDREQLLKTIHRLYEGYVDTYAAMQDLSRSYKEASKELFRSLAVQMDFVKDYKHLLKGNNDMGKLLSGLI